MEDPLIGAGDTGPYTPANNYSLMFGPRHNNAAPNTFGNRLNGRIDGVAIWDTALDQAQVSTVFGGGAGGLSIQDSIGKTTFEVEWDIDLDGTWTASVVIGATSSVGSNGEIVTVTDTSSPDEIQVFIPASKAVDGKIFARLKATEIP